MIKISYVESRLPEDKEIVFRYGLSSTDEITMQMLDEMQIKMLHQPANKWKKGFEVREIPFDNLHYMVNSDYRIYSAGVFKDGVATDDNWLEQDLLILDIDDGLTILEALTTFKGYKALITTTKSHQVDKNGTTCDRFRVIIPLKETLCCTKEEYKDAMKFILGSKYPFADNKCKDPSRIYFGKSNAEYYYTNGDMFFDFENEMKIAKEIKLFTSKYEPSVKQVPLHDGTKIDWYRENWLNDNMRRVLKVDEKFVEGGRNTTLFSYGKLFKEMGMTDSEVVDIVLWINAGQLEESEIVNTIFKSLKIKGN